MLAHTRSLGVTEVNLGGGPAVSYNDPTSTRQTARAGGRHDRSQRLRASEGVLGVGHTDGERLSIAVFDGEAGRDQIQLIRPIYTEVYADPPYGEGPDDVEEFATASWPRRVAQPAFRAVIARVDGDPVGFTFGHQLPDGTQWWSALLDESVPAEVTEEWPGRTFAVIELAVRAGYRGRGVARALHDALLAARPEERVTLLCRPEPEAEPAQAAYKAWGYERVGPLRPFDGAPVYDAMLLPLR